VAIVPVGHDFPPFSANKGGSTNGTKLFLLTFDLAFQLQEQLQAMESGGNPPDGFRRDAASRVARVPTTYTATPVVAIASSALARKIRLVRDENSVISAESRLRRHADPRPR
jgi:hypothetical protein